NDFIVLKEYEPLSLVIVALVVSQSVGLEKYEQDLDVYFRQSRRILDIKTRNYLIKRSKLATFAKNLTFIRHGMLSDLLLLDKPNILWDNEEAENIYNILASSLEIKDRFKIVSFKLESLKNDTNRALGLINQKHSEFLEWVIILLICAEIVVMLIEFFK
ncbi:MAG: RMD1 family protein, partial [Sulfurospirillaceae bacterium]|nr:RMD1 family protein [Sulfurospirillaceae bacterium]